METDHRIVVDDARHLDAVGDDTVELVVTSPPYPMIEMWDDLFSELDPAIGASLDAGDGWAAFESMHDALRPVWRELERVLVDGGIACINVGDATRTLDGCFRVYPNHARIVEGFTEVGFDPLPGVLWWKPTNAGTKFMGSGMLPPNAYVTLEHEHILVFRNGSGSRGFEAGSDRRYEAAYFWEERNEWFSDVWTDVAGESQALSDGSRSRSGAYPFEIPYRLINMYSVYGDTVLDPFWGTGTTTLAAMVAARNSVGYELEGSFVEGFEDRLGDIEGRSRSIGRERLAAHRRFVAEARADGREFEYTAKHYDVPVTTRQERSIRLYAVADIHPTPEGYRLRHTPIETIPGVPDR